MYGRHGGHNRFIALHLSTFMAVCMKNGSYGRRQSKGPHRTS